MNTRIISLISHVSGNGKTTAALNLGLAFHKLGKKAIVIDGDFTKPNMAEHLAMAQGSSPSSFGMDDVLSDKEHILDVIYTHPSGLKVIPSYGLAGNSKENSNLAYHLQDLLADYNFIILDTPESVIPALPIQSINEALIIHSPVHSSKYVADAISMINKRRLTLLGIIMNKSKDSSHSILGYPIIANIPLHKHVLQSYKLKHPVIHSFPSSIVSKKFMHIAKMLV